MFKRNIYVPRSTDGYLFSSLNFTGSLGMFLRVKFTLNLFFHLAKNKIDVK